MGNLAKYVEAVPPTRRERMSAFLRSVPGRVKAWYVKDDRVQMTSTAPGFGQTYQGWCEEHGIAMSRWTGMPPAFGKVAKENYIRFLNREPIIPEPPAVAVETVKAGSGTVAVTVT